MTRKSPTVSFVHVSTPLGPAVLAASSAGLAGVWFVGQRHMPDLENPGWAPAQTPPPLLALAAQHLDEYFLGKRRVFDLPLDLSCGTDFQQRVWAALRGIALVSTVSYGQLARQLGQPLASRAVGVAVGRNPISIVVPCHRVVGSSGQLTGYAGGLERKRALLQLESRF